MPEVLIEMARVISEDYDLPLTAAIDIVRSVAEVVDRETMDFVTNGTFKHEV